MENFNFFYQFDDDLIEIVESTSDIICQACGLGNPKFVGFLSNLGIIVNILLLWDIFRHNEVWKNDFWRNRVPRNVNRWMSEETELKWKMAASIIYLQSYLLMFISLFMNVPHLLSPWLVIQGAVLVLEFILFILRVVIDKTLPSRVEVAMNLIFIHNYIQVYCYRQQM